MNYLSFEKRTGEWVEETARAPRYLRWTLAMERKYRLRLFQRHRVKDDEEKNTLDVPYLKL